MGTDRKSFAFDVAVDDELLDIAERDVFRALVLQNSRVAQRFDLAGRFRTHEAERRLRRFALLLCGLGVVLALILVVGRGLSLGAVQPRDLILLIITTALLLIFQFINTIRQRGVDRLDKILARRAATQFAAMRKVTPVTLRYSVASGVLRCEELSGETPRLRFERPLASSRYALCGAACTALFPTMRKQTPNILVVTGGDVERAGLAEVLREGGLQLEQLHRDLMPSTTIERAW